MKKLRKIKKSLTYHRGVYYIIHKDRNNVRNKKFKNKEIIR